MEPIRIFIGHDHVEEVAFHVLCNSIWRRASVPVSIIPIMKHQMDTLIDRPREPEQSNEFTFTRWLVPYLCHYSGYAIFMDCDMLVMDDIAKLWALRSPNYAVQCVKHNHVPNEETKFLGMLQTAYEKKNWASMMIFNNAMCRKLTPYYINNATRLELHQFGWLGDDSLIGELPERWNHLVDVQPYKQAVSNVHYTLGGPYFDEYQDCYYNREWFDERSDMLHCQQLEEQ